jgi:hypothetical protein
MVDLKKHRNALIKFFTVTLDRIITEVEKDKAISSDYFDCSIMISGPTDIHMSGNFSLDMTQPYDEDEVVFKEENKVVNEDYEEITAGDLVGTTDKSKLN